MQIGVVRTKDPGRSRCLFDGQIATLLGAWLGIAEIAMFNRKLSSGETPGDLLLSGVLPGIALQPEDERLFKALVNQRNSLVECTCLGILVIEWLGKGHLDGDLADRDFTNSVDPGQEILNRSITNRISARPDFLG